MQKAEVVLNSYLTVCLLCTTCVGFKDDCELVMTELTYEKEQREKYKIRQINT